MRYSQQLTFSNSHHRYLGATGDPRLEDPKLQDPRFSVVNSLTIHPLVHIVRDEAHEDNVPVREWVQGIWSFGQFTLWSGNVLCF